ncbi:MAG: UbiA prenyltransferase family protein [Acidobacteria bacterium]|nr:UbiA prenyltransferase family protein [Acidobacteriota bacterium]
MGPGDLRLRRIAGRVFGTRALPYLLHLRPMEWPIMSAHFLLGTLLAAGWNLPLGLTLLAWTSFVVALNGGTLAINSAFDKDEGDIGYLRQPPPPPRHLLAFSSGLLLLALLMALPFFAVPPAGDRFFWIVAACVAMSVLYSVPPARLKARAGWDLLINCAGFGLLTPLGGWALTGRPFTPAILWAAWGFFLLFAALYPMTQIYQVQEDRARGDRTLVIRLGEGPSLALALVAALGAHACILRALLHAGRPALPLLLSLGAWVLVILPWQLRWRRMSQDQHQAGMYRGLGAWAVTDLSVLLLLWPR